MHGLFRQEYPPEAGPRLDIAEARRYLELAKQELGIEKLPPLVLLTGDDPVSAPQAEYFRQVFKQTLDLDLKIDQADLQAAARKDDRG